jgi:hypothetical protein
MMMLGFLGIGFIVYRQKSNRPMVRLPGGAGDLRRGRLWAACFLEASLRQPTPRYLDSKIVHLFSRPELRGKPTLLLAAPGPRFRRVIWIAKFWKDGRVLPTLRSGNAPFKRRFDFELLQTLFKHVFLSHQFYRQGLADLNVQLPQIVGGHPLEFD